MFFKRSLNFGALLYIIGPTEKEIGICQSVVKMAEHIGTKKTKSEVHWPPLICAHQDFYEFQST